MTRTIPLALALALCTLTPALADFPTHYALRGDAGSGSLDLLDAGQTVIRQREKLAVKVALELGEESLELTGTLTRSGDVFRGDLAATSGMAGGLQQLGIAPWKAELSEGLQIGLELQRLGRKLNFVGRASLGPRSAANEATIRRFYEAFQRKDAAGMAQEYAANVRFSDRVFPNLEGDEPGSMWAMLCESEDLTLTFSGVRAGERYGVARWVANYSVFGNKVVNVIDANFEFDAEGKIVRHVDRFDFARWVKQALPGPARFVPTSALLTTIRTATAFQLHRYRSKQAK
ncbi:MAG: nuclear transport factor 2 family protein [Planctomycetota bacterium]